MTTAPMEGWAWHIGLYQDPATIQTLICVDDNGTRNGNIEFGSGQATVELFCEKETPDGGWIEYVSYIINWGAACQGGYAATDVETSPRLSIGSCVKTGYIPGQPEVCCESAGNPIMLSSRRKVQSERDYTGTGSYPLEFIRTYSSSKPGINSGPINARVRVWGHNFEKHLSGDLHGPTPGLGGGGGDYFQIGGGYWQPAPRVSGGLPGGDFNAHRPDGTIIHFTDLSSASNRQVYLSQATTPRGEVGFVLKTATDEEEFYNQLGRLTATRSRSGETHYVNYAVSGLVKSVVDDYGKSLTFEYSGGHLSAVVDPDGNRISYTYNVNGDYATVTYPDTGSGGNQRTYVYDAMPRFLTGIIDERGVRYTSWLYGTSGAELGLGTESSAPDGINRVQVSRYGNSGAVRTEDALGLQVIYNFSTVNGGKVLKSKQRLATGTTPAATETRTHDADGFITSITDWNQNTTTYTRNSRGLPTLITQAAGTPSERSISRLWHGSFRLPITESYPDYTVDYTHDENGNVLTRSVTDNASSLTRLWSYSYDSFGKILTEDGPRTDVNDSTSYTYYNCVTGNECGQLSSVTNGAGHTTSLASYNAHGQPTRIVDANDVITTLSYDNRLRLINRTTDNQPLDISYDNTGNIVRVTLADDTYTDYTWDNAGRLVAIADAEGNKIEWTLDVAGNRTEEVFKDSSGSIKKLRSRLYDALSRLITLVPNHGGTTAYVYDDNGNQVSMVDAKQRSGLQGYDALDRLVSLQDALQGITGYQYDTQDNIVSIADPENLTTTYTYNGFGDQLSVNSPDTGTTHFTVDAAGNRISETDARGVTVNFTYDALNRLTSSTYPDSSLDIHYTYDQGSNAIGLLSNISDDSGSTSYGYDGRGNVTSVTHTIASQQYSTAFEYNGADRLISFTYPSGRVLNYLNDASGRIEQVTNNDSAQSEVLANAIGRLPFGPITGMTLGNGISRERTYDQDYRVQNINDGTVLSRNYGYSPVDNITAITDSIVPGLSQLFTYDALDRLDFATGDYGDKTFGYDGIGNRQFLTLETPTDSESQAYQYSPDSHRLGAISGRGSFQYDASGNMLDNGKASFTYNQRNRMNSATASGETTNYLYNALGQRVSKGGSAYNIHYIYDLDGHLIAEADSAGFVQVEYAYLDNEPLAMWREAPLYGLYLDTVDAGRYGHSFQGTSNYQSSYSTTFAGETFDVQLSVDGYDIDYVDEVDVLVNGVSIGFLFSSAENALQSSVLLIPSELMNSGSNLLEFRQKNPGWVWGVTNLLIEESTGYGLSLNIIDGGRYGNNFQGTSNYQTSYSTTFAGETFDVQLTVDGYDIDYVDEIEVLVNGVSIGFLASSANNAVQSSALLIPSELMNSGHNLLEFKQKNPEWVWGVTNILLERVPDYGLVLNVTDTGKYGFHFLGVSNHQASYSTTFAGEMFDLQLSVDGYDIDYIDEIEVLVNSVSIGYLSTGANNGIQSSVFQILSSQMNVDSNSLEFKQKNPGWVWGVTNLTLSSTGGQ